MIEALDKTHCYTLQKQNKTKRFGQHNPVSNRKLSPTSFNQVPQNSQLSFSRQCTPETHSPTSKNSLSLKTPNFLSLDNAPRNYSHSAPRNICTLFLSLSLSQKSQLSFSRQCTPKTHISHLEKYALSLSLSLSLSKSDRASGSAHHFLPRTHSLGRRRAGLHL